MALYVLRRILISIPVLLGITLLTFIAYNLAPGDPIDAMIDPSVAMDPVDLLFMLAEGRERPTHVGGLQLFTTPDDAGPSRSWC